MRSNVNQPTTPQNTSQLGASTASSSAHSDLVSELQTTRHQLKSVSQQNQQLIQQNQQLRVEIERIMASALNLHHIVYSEQPAAPPPSSTPSSSPDNEGAKHSAPTVSESQRQADGDADVPAFDVSTPDPIAPNASVPKADAAEAHATEASATDMFAELDRLLADDLLPPSGLQSGLQTGPQPSPQFAPQPVSRDDDESLKAALSHVNARPRASAATGPPKPSLFKPPHLRQTVAVPPSPPTAKGAPRRPNLWLILAVVAVMLSCFGAGFLLTLPLLQQSSDR